MKEFDPLSSYCFPELIIKRGFRRLSPEKQKELLAEFLKDISAEELLFLLEASGFFGYIPKVHNLILALLKREGCYRLVAQFLEHIAAGQFYAPEIVEAAEYYEKIGDLEKALELYTKGLEVCDPRRIEVYDENTGGYVSAMDYPELNKEKIERAVNLVKKCEEKIEELKRKIQRREKDSKKKGKNSRKKKKR